MARKRKKQYEIKPEEIKLKKTLFYQLILDLERLAQFDSASPYNITFPLMTRTSSKGIVDGIDYSKSVSEIDDQLFKKYDFTEFMITLIKERYSYDDISISEK